MKKIAIIDYGSGNIHSITKAFEQSAGAGNIVTTNSADDLKDAKHIVLPGVGDFSDCYKGLAAIPGMIGELEKQVLQNKKPFLGICVGMQLLAEKGYERGVHSGLGWIKGEVVKIKPGNDSLKIPHMGWNEISVKQKQNPLFNGIKDHDHFYFVHSYQFVCKNESDIVADTDYDCTITAAIAKNNIYGVQFHPEKSQKSGLKLIENFCAL